MDADILSFIIHWEGKTEKPDGKEIENEEKFV